jgi:hypothetical protein
VSSDVQPVPTRSGGRALHTWLVLLITLPYMALVTYGDVTCFLELWYPLRWLFAAYYVMLVAGLARRPAGKWIAGVALAWMLLVLPQVRWNHSKSFYVDARRLRTGMSVVEVRGIMATYFEQGALGAVSHPDDRLVYLPSPDGLADECEVRFDSRGGVRDIVIQKD